MPTSQHYILWSYAPTCALQIYVILRTPSLTLPRRSLLTSFLTVGDNFDRPHSFPRSRNPSPNFSSASRLFPPCCNRARARSRRKAVAMRSPADASPAQLVREVGRSCCVLKFRGKTVMFDCGIHPAHSGMSTLPYFDHINPAEVDLLLVTRGSHMSNAACLTHAFFNGVE